MCIHLENFDRFQCNWIKSILCTVSGFRYKLLFNIIAIYIHIQTFVYLYIHPYNHTLIWVMIRKLAFLLRQKIFPTLNAFSVRNPRDLFCYTNLHEMTDCVVGYGKPKWCWLIGNVRQMCHLYCYYNYYYCY